ncbi:MAG: hypothetical protein ABH829_05485 [archaeon]
MKLEEKLTPSGYELALNTLKNGLRDSEEKLSKKVKEEGLVAAVGRKLQMQKECDIEKFTSGMDAGIFFRFVYSHIGDLATNEKIEAVSKEIERETRDILSIASKKKGIDRTPESFEFAWSSEKKPNAIIFEKVIKNEIIREIISKKIAFALLEEKSSYALDNLIKYYSDQKYSLQSLVKYAEEGDFEKFAENTNYMRKAVQTGMTTEFPITNTILLSEGTERMTNKIARACMVLTWALGVWDISSAVFRKDWGHARGAAENELFSPNMFGISIRFKFASAYLNNDGLKAIAHILRNSTLKVTIAQLIKNSNDKGGVSEIDHWCMDLIIESLDSAGLKLKNTKACKEMIMMLVLLCRHTPGILENPKLLLAAKGT